MSKKILYSKLQDIFYLKNTFNLFKLNFSDVGGHKETDINKLKERLSYWLGTYWVEFDHVYMKPSLVHNWPHVKEENDELSSKILELANEYSNELKEKKKHRNEEEENDRNNFNRIRPGSTRDNLTELRPVITEEENLCKE